MMALATLRVEARIAKLSLLQSWKRLSRCRLTALARNELGHGAFAELFVTDPVAGEQRPLNATH